MKKPKEIQRPSLSDKAHKLTAPELNNVKFGDLRTPLDPGTLKPCKQQ